MRRKYRVGLGVLAVLLSSLPLLFDFLHHFLIVDTRCQAYLILVPSGDFGRRSREALLLARQGFGKSIVIDEGADWVTFGRTLAQRRTEQLKGNSLNVSVCPVRGETTVAESKEARLCIAGFHPQRVLIVTSDFHTRRSLAIFQKEMPDIAFHVASVETEYSEQVWWRPESIATTCEEWVSLLWWRLTK